MCGGVTDSQMKQQNNERHVHMFSLASLLSAPPPLPPKAIQAPFYNEHIFTMSSQGGLILLLLQFHSKDQDGLIYGVYGGGFSSGGKCGGE